MPAMLTASFLCASACLNPSQGDSADARKLKEGWRVQMQVSIPLRVIRPMPESNESQWAAARLSLNPSQGDSADASPAIPVFQIAKIWSQSLSG